MPASISSTPDPTPSTSSTPASPAQHGTNLPKHTAGSSSPRASPGRSPAEVRSSPLSPLSLLTPPAPRRPRNESTHAADRSVSTSSSTSSSGLGIYTPSRSSSPFDDGSRAARDELNILFQSISALPANAFDAKLTLLSHLQRLLQESRSRAPRVIDAHALFARSGGFLVIVQILSSLAAPQNEPQQTVSAEGSHQDSSSQAVPPQDSSPEATLPAEDGVKASEQLRIDIFQQSISILAEVIDDNARNLDHFESTVGWEGLSSAMEISALEQTSPAAFFGALIGLALADVLPVSALVSRLWAESHEEAGQCQPDVQIKGDIKIPQVLGIILRKSSQSHPIVTATLASLIRQNKRNSVILRQADVTRGVLQELLSAPRPLQGIHTLRLSLLRSAYIAAGIPDSDANLLLRHVHKTRHDSDPFRQLLLDVAQAPALPDLVNFDLSLHGHASVALTSLRKPFPPVGASDGWSFFTSLIIDAEDPYLPVELLHIFDAQRISSVKLLIQDTLHYVSHPDAPPVEFAKFRFEPKRLYHLAFVHQRPRGNNPTSIAQLYVDGRLVGEQAAPWPANTQGSPVRAVFGTAPMQADQPPRTSQQVWSMGPVYLLDQCLPSDFALVLSELGPNYGGNLQDSLGRFLTYQASTKINLRLDTVARNLSKHGVSERELNRHPLVTSIAGRASELFAEERFYFALNPACTALRQRPTASQHPNASHKPGATVLLNQVVTLTREALAASYGYAKVYGSPLIQVQSRLDDIVWRLGGCAFLLHLIEVSHTSASLLQSLTFFFEMLQRSWRLCEDAEKVRAYEILNMLLRQKNTLVTTEALQILLKAVGINAAESEEAALVNPFMYRVITLDFQLWATTSEAVQAAHLAHFSTLLRVSKHRRFNIKRIAKMLIVKKLLYRLRANHPSVDICRHILDTLRTLLVASWSDAALKAVTTYLAAKLCRTRGKMTPRNPRRGVTLDLDSQSSSHGGSQTGDGQQAEHPDLPLQIFEMFTALALDRPNYLGKLAQTVHVKWLLLFFHPSAERRAAVLALKLLSTLLIRQPNYAERLSVAGGWKVLERLLPSFWEEPSVLPSCFAILFGQERQPNISLAQAYAPPKNVYCEPMLRVVLGCFREALGAAIGKNDVMQRATSANRPRPSDLLAPPSPSPKQRHARKRSNSTTLDTRSLAATFKETSQQVMIKDTVAIIEMHANDSSTWRELLFTPLVLRLLCEALEPFVQSLGGNSEKATMSPVEADCDRLLDTIVGLATNSMLVDGSVTRVNALVASIPPRDLAQQGAFRSALTKKILRHIEAYLNPRNAERFLPSTSSLALAHFIEQISHDALHGSALEDLLFNTVSTLLAKVEEHAEPDAKKAAASLHSSLNRMALYKLSTPSILATLQQIINWQTLFLGSNPDTVFIECLANRVLHHVQSEDSEVRQASLNILKLITLSKPEVAEAALPTGSSSDDILGLDISSAQDVRWIEEAGGAAFETVWTGFMKAADTLHTATHLERIAQLRQLLDQTESREKATASTEKRMVAWHASLCTSEDERYVKHLIDLQEMQQAAALEYQRLAALLTRERSLLGPEEKPSRVWQLDPTEGPRRMRKRLVEQPRAAEDPAGSRAVTSVPATPVLSSGAEHGDPWGSGEAQMVEEPTSAVEQALDYAVISAPDEPVSATGPDFNRNEPVQLDLDDHEHKYRKVLRSIEKGDRVGGVVNASRVVGIDCRAALLMTGKLSLYLVDDFFQRSNGELVNVWQAPEAERDAHVLAALSSDSNQPSAFIEQLEGEGQTRKWPWSSLRRVHRRAFLHRGTALELFFDDGQSCLLVLPTVAETNALYKDLGSRCRIAITGAEQMREGIREPPAQASADGRVGGFSARLGAVLGRQSAGVITEAWRQRKISNFDYIMKLNTLAGRSFNDLSQYPVFPWVISDYSSAALDLSNPATFRQLDKPMGAQTKERQKQFQERYESLVEIDETPFHYGTHFSTAATTAGYLIRLRPFDKLLMALQGGTFDLAERTFASIEKAWKSASEVSRGDVRELIPEFFYLPDFLVNSNRFNFGATQTGSKIDDVELPPWAKDDPLLFVQKNREALESDYVSANLHHWIDLVFGHKQSGEAAVKATNVFHPLSYADEVDLDSISDPNERMAASQTVWNFGVCPARLFERPHIARNPADLRLDLFNMPWMAIQNIAPLRTLKSACHFIYAENPQRAYSSPSDYLILPRLGVSLSSGHLDGSLRMFKSGDAVKPIAVAEQAGVERILCMTQAGPSTVVAGCKDGLVLLWKVDLPRKELTMEQPLRGHTGQVVCLAASQSWRIAVSGSDDGTAIIWDTNRATYVRSLRAPGGGPVTNIAVDEEEGFIATASGQDVSMWSINGELLARVAASASVPDPITSVGFVSRDGHVDRLAMLLTGHCGKVVAWSCTFAEKEQEDEAGTSEPENDAQPGGSKRRGGGLPWNLQSCHVFKHHDRLGATPPSNITALHVGSASSEGGSGSGAGQNGGQGGPALPSRYLFTGDELGRLNVWTLPGDAFAVPEGYAEGCMACGKKWGVLETRRACRGCGGLFCGACAEPVQLPLGGHGGGSGSGAGESALASRLGNGRFCASCREVCGAAF